jgi:putative phosphoserine phosphatase/1-acylglycerol-3-phosphate O-acyltransferase
MAFARPSLAPYADIEIVGEQRIPATGAAIVVANHRSYFDPTLLGMVIAKRGRTVRFLGKKEVFDVPLVGSLVRAMGGIRVDRGTGSDEPLDAAAAALEGGELVALMPQGTIPRGQAFFDPKLKGRWGAARLAHLTGAPVIPIGIWGTEKVWPRNARVPRLLNVFEPPKVTATVGKRVKLEGVSVEADTKRIMKAIAKQLPPEARHPHAPTDEELLATYPPGWRGDED